MYISSYIIIYLFGAITCIIAPLYIDDIDGYIWIQTNIYVPNHCVCSYSYVCSYSLRIGTYILDIDGYIWIQTNI